MTECEGKTSTSKFLSVHSRSREPSPAKSECDSERSGKRRGIKWFKSIRKAVGAIGGFKKRPSEPTVEPEVKESPSVISIERLDESALETIVIQDVRKDRPKGPPGRKRSSQMMKMNSQNKLVTVQAITEESESKISVVEESRGTENGVKEEVVVNGEEVVENGVHSEGSPVKDDIELEEEFCKSALSKKVVPEVPEVAISCA